MADNPTLGSIRAQVRLQSGETDPTGRWSDAQINPLIRQAELDLGFLLEWPEAQRYFTTVSTIGEYKLAEAVNIRRVRIGGPPGMAFVPTTIDMLEGTQLGLYDNTSTSPPYTAQWMSQPPAAVPAPNGMGYGAALMVPWRMNSRPKYYLRGSGAIIGFVPAPSIAYIVQLDLVDLPVEMQRDQDSSSFPAKAVDALAEKTMYYMAKADKDNEGMLMHEHAYGGQNGTGGLVGKLLSWREDALKFKSRTPLFVTARTHFRGPGRYATGRGRGW